MPPPVPLFTQDKPQEVALQDLSRCYKEDLTMPQMINLETVGRRRSPQESTRPNRFGFTSAVTKLFAFGTLLNSTSACPKDSTKTFLTHAHTSISTAIDTCHTVNRNFDGTQNEILFLLLLLLLNGRDHKVLAAGKEHDEL